MEAVLGGVLFSSLGPYEFSWLMLVGGNVNLESTSVLRESPFLKDPLFP